MSVDFHDEMQCNAMQSGACNTIRVPENCWSLPMDGMEEQVEGLRNNSNTDSEPEGRQGMYFLRYTRTFPEQRTDGTGSRINLP